MTTAGTPSVPRPRRGVRLPLAAFVWLLLLVLDVGYAVTADHPLGPRAFASLALQHALVTSLWMVADAATPWRSGRGLLLLLLFAYLAWHLLDIFSLYLLTAHATDVVRILGAGADAFEVLSQTGIAGVHVAAVAAAAVAALAAFAALRRVLPRVDLPRGRRGVAVALLAVALFAWAAEQALARRAPTYLDRATYLPTYARLFATPVPVHVAAIPPLPPDAWLTQRLAAVTAPEQPWNVLFVLLESVRDDVVSPEFAPRIHALGRSSVRFTRALTESVFTPLSWNALLMNRPAYTLRPDVAASRRRAASELPGAFPLRVLGAAGYTVHLAMPSDLAWMDFEDRILGGRGAVDHYFSSYPGHNDARNVADDAATAQVVRWIEAGPPEPFFMMIELDSTHWTYFFDDDAVVVKPFAPGIRPQAAASQQGLDLLHNRYRNAMRHVDNNVGRMLDALAARRLGERTAVVVVSDHGEGFAIGNTGHTHLAPETLHVPWILSLPGLSPRAVGGIVTTRSVFPTLFALLGIRGLDPRALLGRPVDLDGGGAGSALTFHGSMKAAELTLPAYSVRFEVSMDATGIDFAPIGVRDARGRPVPGWVGRLEALPWREALDDNVTGIFAEKARFQSSR